MAAKVMLIAGETSGDRLGAEFVRALKSRLPADSIFFGAGGPQMAAAGVKLEFDLTRHAVIGLWDVLRNYFKFRRLFHQLLDAARQAKPDLLVCIDFSGFNSRFASAVRKLQRGLDEKWSPRIVQFVSPQVWASRPKRAQRLARDFDLLLSIFPFEKDWYAQRAPGLRVEFVGHPLLDRHLLPPPRPSETPADKPLILLLPGSRASELKRHLPVMLDAAHLLDQTHPARFRIVLPHESLQPLARETSMPFPGIEIQIGDLPASLAKATLALASTGTVTMECAFFGVPTVTLYKTNWSTYQIARRIITVRSLTMPNLLADEVVYPEFVQYQATPENLAHAARELLENPQRRDRIRTRLAEVIATLGKPGACNRAASLVSSLLQ